MCRVGTRGIQTAGSGRVLRGWGRGAAEPRSRRPCGSARARCAGAFGVHARAAALRWARDPGHGREGQAAALGCWSEVFFPHPQFRRCPFPLLRVGLFTSCSAATRGSAPPDPAPRPERRVQKPFGRQGELGAG